MSLPDKTNLIIVGNNFRIDIFRRRIVMFLFFIHRSYCLSVCPTTGLSRLSWVLGDQRSLTLRFFPLLPFCRERSDNRVSVRWTWLAQLLSQTHRRFSRLFWPLAWAVMGELAANEQIYGSGSSHPHIVLRYIHLLCLALTGKHQSPDTELPAQCHSFFSGQTRKEEKGFIFFGNEL